MLSYALGFGKSAIRTFYIVFLIVDKVCFVCHNANMKKCIILTLCMSATVVAAVLEQDSLLGDGALIDKFQRYVIIEEQDLRDESDNPLEVQLGVFANPDDCFSSLEILRPQAEHKGANVADEDIEAACRGKVAQLQDAALKLSGIESDAFVVELLRQILGVMENVDQLDCTKRKLIVFGCFAPHFTRMAQHPKVQELLQGTSLNFLDPEFLRSETAQILKDFLLLEMKGVCVGQASALVAYIKDIDGKTGSVNWSNVVHDVVLSLQSSTCQATSLEQRWFLHNLTTPLR